MGEYDAEYGTEAVDRLKGYVDSGRIEQVVVVPEATERAAPSIVRAATQPRALNAISTAFSSASSLNGFNKQSMAPSAIIRSRRASVSCAVTKTIGIERPPAFNSR